MRKLYLKLALSLFLLVLPAYSNDVNSLARCLAITAKIAGGLPVPIAQWQVWETQANAPMHQGPSGEVSLDVVTVSESEFAIQTIRATQENQALLSALKAEFNPDGKILWVKHPYNTYEEVPFYHSEVDFRIKGLPTASRSVGYLSQDKFLVTLKLPSNRFQPNTTEYTQKADMSKDLAGGIRRSQYYQKREDTVGRDPSLIVLKDVMSIQHKYTGNGILIRDLSPMFDGNYYLPAFSLPRIGRELAARENMPFIDFMKRYYVVPLGAAKAKLLMTAGIQMKTPNAQNWMLQLDNKLRPTGVLVLRDINDFHFVEGAAIAIGEKNTFEIDKIQGWDYDDSLKPYGKNSLWKFDESAEYSLTKSELDELLINHDLAYVQTLSQNLNIAIPLPDSYQQGSGQGNESNFIRSANETLSQTQWKSLNTYTEQKSKIQFHQPN